MIQRVLFRHGVSRELASLLIEDIKRCLAYLKTNPRAKPLTAPEATGFHH